MHDAKRIWTALCLLGGLITMAALTFAATSIAQANGGGHSPITICHWVPAHGGSFVVITIDENGLHGHGGHDNDIIPMPAGGCPSGEEEAATTTPQATGTQEATNTATPTATATSAGGGATATFTATETSPTPTGTSTQTPESGVRGASTGPSSGPPRGVITLPVTGSGVSRADLAASLLAAAVLALAGAGMSALAFSRRRRI